MSTVTMRDGIDVDQLVGMIDAEHAANAAASGIGRTRMRDCLANPAPIDTALELV